MLKVGGQTIPNKTILLAASQTLVILLSLAAITLMGLDGVPARLGALDVWLRLGLVTLLCTLILYYNDLFDFRVLRRAGVVCVRLLRSLGVACLCLALLYRIEPELALRRGTSVIAVPAVFVALLGWLVAVRKMRLFDRAGERLLIVGTGDAGMALEHEISRRPALNIRVVGFLAEKSGNHPQASSRGDILGEVSELSSVLKRKRVDRVALSFSERRGRMPVDELLALKLTGVRVEDVHTTYEALAGRILTAGLSPSALIFSTGFRKGSGTQVIKRSLDMLLSLLALVVFSPLLLLISVAIWLETGSPILFRQKRVGYHEREFEIMKFRSMRINAEANGPLWATGHDPRATHVGRIIRRFRLDELPQLFNVLRGEMSIAGPRPERPEFCRWLEEELPFFRLRHTVRPGLTGWAQVRYRYGSTVEEARVKLEHDLFYIKHLSLGLDFVILFETVKVVLLGRGAA